METIELINGNERKYTVDLPKIRILGIFNNIALNHLEINTGLQFTVFDNYMEAQPISSQQITKLFLTYNFKTQYYNNWNYKNTLMLKSDHHIGFDVDSICFDCCKKNHINTNGMDENSRLAC